MTTQESAAYTIAAVRESALELGLHPLSDEIVERVIDYGLEALIECTLANDQPYVIDANVRGVIYAHAIARIGDAVAERYSREPLVV